MARYIDTVLELRRAIRRAEMILIQPRFGVSEKWVAISKSEARVLVDSLPLDATPHSAEMYSGHFGKMTDGGWLHLG